MRMRHCLWAACLAALLLMVGCGSGQGEGTDEDASAPYVLEENDSALMAAMDAAHAEFGPQDTLPAASEPAKEGEQRLEGTFVEMQEGDYMHFVMKDGLGNLRSFFLAKELPSAEWEPYLEGGKQGTKVAVTWRKVDRYLEAAGAINAIEEVVRIEAR
jgi:hypothetical protein